MFAENKNRLLPPLTGSGVVWALLNPEAHRAEIGAENARHTEAMIEFRETGVLTARQARRPTTLSALNAGDAAFEKDTEGDD